MTATPCLPSVVSIEDISRATSRLPFSSQELEAAILAVKNGQAKGRDCLFGSFTFPIKATKKLFGEGMLIVTSPEFLKLSFLFVKLDGGRSIFGNQKARYSSYVGDPHGDEWMPGPTFKNWLMAITSIGNAYRGYGGR